MMNYTELKKEWDAQRGWRAYAYFRLAGTKSKVRFGRWGKGKDAISETQEKYERYLAKYLTTPQLPVTKEAVVTIDDLVGIYRAAVEKKVSSSHYGNITHVTDLLLHYYKTFPVNDFDKGELDEFRDIVIHSRCTPENVKTKNATPLCTETVNKYIDIIRHMFEWGGAEKLRKEKGKIIYLVDDKVTYSLSLLKPLEPGAEGTLKSKIIESAVKNDVIATRQQCHQMIGDMLWVQYLCAMRSQGVRLLRPCDIDTSHEIWTYNPHCHKTQSSGKNPPIPIEPRAKDILVRYISEMESRGAPADEYIFSPKKAMALISVEKAEKRKSKVQPSQQKRKENARTNGRKYLPCYTKDAYGNAIERAIEKAKVPKWTSHQLRHMRATEVYEDHGENAVMTLLGHSSIEVTRRYIDKYMKLKVQKKAARDVMRDIINLEEERKKTA